MKQSSTRSLIALLTLSMLPVLNANDLVILSETGVRNLRIETAQAMHTDFESTVFAIGRIEEIPAYRSVLSSRIAGRITKINAFEGDYVTKGQILAHVESRQPGDPPPSIQLRAPQDGLIVESHVRLGQPVEPNAELMDISDHSQVWAIAKIPETEAAQVDISSIAHIKIPALGNQPIDATLVRFGVNADRQAGTVDGIFQIANPEGKLRPGMRAEFSIVLSQRSNVLMIPRQSIQGDPANRLVFVKDFDLPNAFVRAPVVLGEQNDAYVEVLSGLFPGDEVVTTGSYPLAFVGNNSGISLKEALDAAHGHEHNEDGSELKPEQRRAEEASQDHGHEHGESHLSRPLLVYSVFVTFVLALLAQRLWGKSRTQPREA